MTQLAQKKKLTQKKAAARRRSTARKTVSRSNAAAPPPAPSPALFYRLHSLLHTVRTIAQYEDQLCTLTEHARTAPQLEPEAREELHALLLELPSSAYLGELEAVHEALHSLDTPARPKPARSRVARR